MMQRIGDPRGLWLMAFAFFGMLALAFAGGCGTTRLERATTSAEVLHELQEGVVQVTALGLRIVLDDRCGDLPNDTEKRMCAESLRLAWQATEGGVNAGAAVIDGVTLAVLTWAERVAADEADEDTPPIEVCEAFEEAVNVVESFAAIAGVPIPELFSCGGES